MFIAKHHLKLGSAGESFAANFLIKNGWMILIRNYRRKCDEIDIIARDPFGTLVFCEVKTLVRIGSFMPEDNLSHGKLRKITRTCEFFAKENPHLISEDKGWRIDLLAIDMGWDEKVLDIRHYENI